MSFSQRSSARRNFYRFAGCASISLFGILSQGCTVVKVADATISTGASVAKTTAKVGVGAVDVVTPDRKKDDHDDN